MIKNCYCCDSKNLTASTYEDWDDVEDIEIIKKGKTCNNCGAFQYEEKDRVIIIPLLEDLKIKETNIGSYIDKK